MNMMDRDSRIAVSRALVGTIAVAMTAAWAVIYLADVSSGFLGPALGRMGILLGALWLALPTKNREAAWARVSPVGLAFLLLALLALTAPPRFRMLAPILFTAAVVAFLLKPRRRR